MSTESIASPAHVADVAESSCVACGASLAEDQRYCLECGERRTPMSSVLLGGPPSGSELSQAQGAATAPPATPPGYGAAAADGAGRGNAVTVIAGVGVLLLAMGVGVLIGRSSAPKQSAAPAQVITVAQPGASTGATTTPTTTPTTPTTSEPAAKGGSTSSKNGSGSKGAASSAGSSKGGSGGGSGGKSAPPATSKSTSPGGGKSYEEKSKNLPDVVSTG